MSVVLSTILVVPLSLVSIDVIALDMVLGMLVSILVVLLVVVNISDDKIGKVSLLDIGIVKLLVEEAVILCGISLYDVSAVVFMVVLDDTIVWVNVSKSLVIADVCLVGFACVDIFSVDETGVIWKVVDNLCGVMLVLF